MEVRSNSIMIVHHGFETISGGEKILLTLMDELIRRGFRVSTVTAWDYEIKNHIFQKVRKYYGISKRIQKMTLIQRTILFNKVLSKALKKERPKVIWTDCEWSKELERYQDGHVIAYYHMPPGSIKIKNGPFIIFRRWLVENYLVQLHEIADLILCNSKFTQERLKKIGINAEVLYPPVKPIKILKKVKQAITVGRLIPAKRHEVAILIAKEVNLPIKVLGWKYWGDLNYFNYIQSICNSWNGASLICDAESRILNEEIGKSLIYLHCNQVEDFGISVVEAMSAGCIPIVYANGGPWIDIIQEGKYGFGFKENNEAVKKIKEILELNNEMLNELRTKIRLRAYKFHESIFRRNTIQLIETFLRK